MKCASVSFFLAVAITVPGYHMVVLEIPASIMNILYSLGQFKFKMTLGYLFVFLLDTFAEVVSRGHWQFGHTHINYKDSDGWGLPS
jgi:hypothetical protein